MAQEDLNEILENEDVQKYLQENFVDKSAFEKVSKKKEEILGEKKKKQEELKELSNKVSEYDNLFDSVEQRGYNVKEILENLSKGENNPEGEVEGAEGENKTPAGLDVADFKKRAEEKLEVQKKNYERKIAALTEEKETKLKELQDQVQGLTSGWDSEKIENTLSAELDRVEVLPKYKKILKDAFRGRAEVGLDEDGERVVQFTGDDGLRRSATEFFDTFSQSEEGKNYVGAAMSAGGGAQGSYTGKHLRSLQQQRKEALEKKDAAAGVSAAMQSYYAKKK